MDEYIWDSNEVTMQGKLRNMASVYIIRDENMLLLYRIGSRVVAPSWCGVGGHFEKEELNDPKAALIREVGEEIGLTESAFQDIELRYITLRYVKNEIRQNYYFFATLKEDIELIMDCSEGTLEWVNISKVNERQMPYTAQYVIEHFIDEGIHNNKLYSGIATPKGVTFVELQEF